MTCGLTGSDLAFLFSTDSSTILTPQCSDTASFSLQLLSLVTTFLLLATKANIECTAHSRVQAKDTTRRGRVLGPVCTPSRDFQRLELCAVRAMAQRAPSEASFARRLFRNRDSGLAGVVSGLVQLRETGEDLGRNQVQLAGQRALRTDLSVCSPNRLGRYAKAYLGRYAQHIIILPLLSLHLPSNIPGYG
jgi:hypothetical protein